MNRQKGSAHVIIVSILVIALIGALGFIFWQNFIYNKPAQEKDTSAKKADTDKPKTQQRQLSSAEKIDATKNKINNAMNSDSYNGLADLMTNPVDGAISHSDGIFNDVSPATMTRQVYQYTSPSDNSYHYSWEFSDFSNVQNSELKKQAANTTFFDFTNSYVAVGISSSASHGDMFVAFDINKEGKITYVFYGLILGT